MTTAQKIIGLTKPYWRLSFTALAFGLMGSGVMGAIAWLVKPALDLVFVDKKMQYMIWIPVGVVVLFTVKGLLHFGQQYLMKQAGLSLIRDTQNKLHSHILTMPAGYFDKEASGILMSRVINDVKMLSALFDEVLRACIIEIPKIVILMGIAFYRKWDMTLACLLIVPVFAVSARKLGKKVKQRSHEAQKNVSYLTHRLGESITGIKVIKVFNREGLRDEKFTTENKNVYRENVRAIRFKEINKLVIDCLTGLAIGFVLIYGGRQVVTGIVTPGDFASILTAIYLVFSPIKQVGESYTTLQGILAAMERVDHVLETKAEDTGSIKIEGFKDGITFEHVWFEFSKDAQTVLHDINLHVRAGEVLALVGPSGAGKTTIAHLLPRFYTPTKGRITIDGVDIREMDIHALRGLIGIVSQDIVLFNDTVRENIAFGSPGAAFEAVKRAADMAFAAEFIEKMPEGYDTILGERGMTLSGGQRQRIAIARAILKNPPIMILDEATSSLDSVSEALVQKALEGLMKDRTTIVIAHRLSTIKNADRIVVLKDGEITDIGTHDELLTANETYRSLYHTFAMTEETAAEQAN
ncbi:ABC transporter ATP-binding protein [Candidatus Magnetominusculus xianensis]|uniref:Multidrug export ATP-binding/permease protein n=1 Tax=Candidatus Magnetominusculus xianensis TaxID=1748249 RepID=A0ABR5SLQ6_9BACT|nr:ABC transporter ATP-binding protein [Candidatus Magnetominusculus xianensis]KWT94961.1 putative multidrug export ATP-binding/permease protein [Candidatus Magnetominusculus xianensis]MBF0405207.1 ABC transporter ATP-binding protein [Nitrospirota bacterium]